MDDNRLCIGADSKSGFLEVATDSELMRVVVGVKSPGQKTAQAVQIGRLGWLPWSCWRPMKHELLSIERPQSNWIRTLWSVAISPRNKE